MCPCRADYLHYDLVAPAEEFAHPCADGAFTFTDSAATLYIVDPSLDRDIDPLHHQLSPPAGERSFLGFEDTVQHPGDERVRHAELQQEKDRPGGIGADGSILGVVDRVLADGGQEGFYGENEAIERCTVGDGLDLARDHFKRQWWRLGGPALLLPFLPPLLDFVVCAVDQVLPCLGDDPRVVVIRRVVDEQG